VVAAARPDEFSVETRTESGRVVVRVTGELDLSTAEQLAAELRTALTAPPVRLVVDASALTFVDSTGLSVLLVAERQARADGGSLVLRHPSHALLRLLELTGTAAVLKPEEPADPS
jgi:anti-sigma B factor antagonist